jgi:signal transduction histidine kinase
VVKETVELCQPDLDRFHVSVRSLIAADLPPVMIDLLQIEQVMINLLRNAIEAISGSSAVRGTVLIEARKVSADFVEVRVADNGPGFPPHFVDSAFLPLTSTKAEGLGVGLSLCRSIVEAHGGQIWLSSNTDGAAIRFTLPIANN